MVTLRNDPYGNFNFLVDLGTGDTDGPAAGFTQVDGLGLEVTYAEYRNGNEKGNRVRKIPGLYRVPNVILRRGVIGSTDLFEWLQRVSEGTAEPRTVRIHLLDQSREVVGSWSLQRSQPARWSGPSLDARGSDVAIEELVLVCEGIDYE